MFSVACDKSHVYYLCISASVELEQKRHALNKQHKEKKSVTRIFNSHGLWVIGDVPCMISQV